MSAPDFLCEINFRYFFKLPHYTNRGVQLPHKKNGEFLFNQYLRKMKKAAINFGYLAALGMATTCIFKFQHWPGAAAIMVLTAAVLSIYFPVCIIDKLRELSDGKTLPSHIALAITVSVTNMGIAFKIHHWPGASILLVLGIGGFSLVYVTLLFIEKLKQYLADYLMYAGGCLGLTTFTAGLLFKIQHWPGAAVLAVGGAALVFLVYFPLYLSSSADAMPNKSNYLRNTFFMVVIGCFVLLSLIK